jgi:hypothetical protein
MMRLGAILVLIGAAGAALAAAADDQALIQQAAAQRTTAKASEQAPQQPPAPAEANDNLSQAERQARNEANLALAKLELILGRKAMMAGKPEAAARKAQHVLVLLRQLPPEIDAAEYELQAEGILAKASRAGVNVTALARDATAETPLPEGDAALDREVQGAARVARQYSGAPRPDIDNSGDARLLRERTLRRQTPDRYGYRPGREIIDVDAVAAADRQRSAYQEALRAAYKADETRLLVEADEARVVPDGDVSYPNDWPQRVARRQKYAGGVVARSPSWYDKDGREWYVAIYDIHDLIYVPPDFGYDSQPLAGPTGLRDALDRQALRERSFIFGGWPEDLAAGIPLLRYFGGLNPWLARGPKYSLERQREIVDMIRAFTGAKVEGERPELPPAP